jgi:hypothetical protein
MIKKVPFDYVYSTPRIESGQCFKPNYLFGAEEKGKAVSVHMDIETYRKLLVKIEELESIRAYDMAEASCDEAIPFEQAILQTKKTLL